MKKNLEGRILTLEDQMVKIWDTVMRGGELHKFVGKFESTVVNSPVVSAKKHKESAQAEDVGATGKLMEEEGVVGKGGEKGIVLITKVNTYGPGARTRNKTKARVEAGKVIFDVLDEAQKAVASDVEATNIL